MVQLSLGHRDIIMVMDSKLVDLVSVCVFLSFLYFNLTLEKCVLNVDKGDGAVFFATVIFCKFFYISIFLIGE